jgi:hypothetical protein
MEGSCYALICDISPEFSGEAEENQENPVKRACLRTKIWTLDILNKKQNANHLTEKFHVYRLSPMANTDGNTYYIQAALLWHEHYHVYAWGFVHFNSLQGYNLRAYVNFWAYLAKNSPEIKKCITF